MVNIWFDDIRKPPYPAEEWIWVRTVEDAIDVLVEHDGQIQQVSLDHDMGLHNIDPETPWNELPFELHHEAACTGYDLVEWIIVNNINCGHINIHSWNPPGAMRMKKAFVAANREAYINPFREEWWEEWSTII